jgi:hypothetical protein
MAVDVHQLIIAELRTYCVVFTKTAPYYLQSEQQIF